MRCLAGFPTGYDSLETVLVLGSAAQVAPYKRTDVDVSIDAGLVIGRNAEVQTCRIVFLKEYNADVRSVNAGLVIGRNAEVRCHRNSQGEQTCHVVVSNCSMLKLRRMTNNMRSASSAATPRCDSFKTRPFTCCNCAAKQALSMRAMAKLVSCKAAANGSL